MLNAAPTTRPAGSSEEFRMTGAGAETDSATEAVSGMEVFS
jgi:hypothetical protein